MTKKRFLLNILGVFVVSIACGSMAQAQATRTWVSGVGDDANPCSRTAPCKTFAGAISKTAACGEISALDPGGFGAVTITKSITINGDGTLAGILAASVNGVIINAGVNDIVTLRSISINGACTGLSGIRILSAKHLHVENCTIYNFVNFGIEGANTVNALEMSIENVSIHNANIGIRQSSLANNKASIDRVRVNRGAFGIDALGGNATVSNSVVSHHNTLANHAGITAEGTSQVNVVNTQVTQNSIGVQAFSNGSTLRFANSDIFNNTTGVNVVAGGICTRFSNSRVAGNTTDFAPGVGSCPAGTNQ